MSRDATEVPVVSFVVSSELLLLLLFTVHQVVPDPKDERQGRGRLGEDENGRRTVTPER